MLIAQVLLEKGAIVHTAAADISLETAIRELHDRRVGALVVMDGSGELLGVVSERDVVRELARRGAEALRDKVAAIMTRDVITAGPDETIDQCLGRMTDRRIRHLPVVEDERLVGLVSIGDLVKHRIVAVEAEAAAMHAYIAAH